MNKDPMGELDPQFSSPEAKPPDWSHVRELLEKAGVYWLTTVRPGGRPHVTSVAGIWLDDTFYFCTGPTERKARNLAENVHCVVTTGCNSFAEGLDVVLEGNAVRASDEAKLEHLARLYDQKYAPMFHFTVRDGAFHGDGGRADVFQISPKKVFGFGRGATYSQTRWKFA